MFLGKNLLPHLQHCYKTSRYRYATMQRCEMWREHRHVPSGDNRFTALVIGPTGCGKMELLTSLIDNANRVANLHPVKIDCCCEIWQERFSQLRGVKFHKDMIDVEERYQLGDGNRWLIIDDLADELVGSHGLNKLFPKQSSPERERYSCHTQLVSEKPVQSVTQQSLHVFVLPSVRLIDHTESSHTSLPAQCQIFDKSI